MSSPIDALAVLGYHRDEAGEWRYGVFGEPVDYPRRLDALDSLFAMQAERDETRIRLDEARIERDECVAVAGVLRDRLTEAQRMVFDVFSQACQVDFDREKQEGTYDHMALSAYEDAQAALIEWGIIRPDQCKGR